MAGRGASVAVLAEWAKNKNAPAHLIELAFDAAEGGPVYMTDAARNIIWNSHNYIGLGQLLGFSGMTESMELRIADVTLELSGVDQTLISQILRKQYIDRVLTVHQMFFDGVDALIVDPVAVHSGRIDEPTISEDPDSGKCVVSLASRDQFADFEKPSGRHTNSHDQNIWFPSDRSFDRLAQLNNMTFTWGHIKEAPATGLGAAVTRLIYSDFWSPDI